MVELFYSSFCAPISGILINILLATHTHLYPFLIYVEGWRYTVGFREVETGK